MKKFTAMLLSLCLLLLPAAGAFAVNESAEGELVIYSSMYPFVLSMLDEALAKEFPNLKPGNGDSFFVYGGSSKLINRIYAEMEDSEIGCDMLLVAEPALSLELKDAGVLAPVEIPGAAELLRFPYDGEGYWYPVRVCNMVLAYNPELVTQWVWADNDVNIPRTFEDFAMDTSLKGVIAMSDPMSSGTTFAAVACLTEHYGRKYLRGLAANQVKIISGSEAIEKIRNGELAAAMILEESVLKALRDAEDSDQPTGDLACIYPEDGVILIPSTVMSIAPEYSKNGNLDACTAVEKWFLSEAAQRIMLQGYMHSVFRSMEEVPVGSIDTNKLIEQDLGVNWENVYRQREEINQAWIEIVANGQR